MNNPSDSFLKITFKIFNLQVNVPFNLIEGKVGTISLPSQGTEYPAGTDVTVMGWGAAGVSHDT